MMHYALAIGLTAALAAKEHFKMHPVRSDVMSADEILQLKTNIYVLGLLEPFCIEPEKVAAELIELEAILAAVCSPF